MSVEVQIADSQPTESLPPGVPLQQPASAPAWPSVPAQHAISAIEQQATGSGVVHQFEPTSPDQFAGDGPVTVAHHHVVSLPPQPEYCGGPAHPSGFVIPQHFNHQPMVVNASGPMSSDIVVPQRPRPGRKPIPQEDAADRRRLQNRIAQRNFRDKRQQRLAETLSQLEQNNREHRDEMIDMERQLEKFRQQQIQAAEQLRREADRADNAERRAVAAEQHAEQLERQLKSSREPLQASMTNSLGTPTGSNAMAPPYAHPSVPTPPEEHPYETDFTYYGRQSSSSHYGFRAAAESAGNSNRMDFSTDLQTENEHCGFCTDNQNCACRQDHKPSDEASAVPLPGSCDACRVDPRRAQACRDMASSARMAPPSAAATLDTVQPYPQRSSGGPAPSPTLPPPPRMSCSAMIDEFHRFGERTSAISSLYRGQLNAYPASRGGYEFEEAQAAAVLSNLSRRNLLQEAEESQHNSAPNPDEDE